jgi:hypothetical protein
MNAVETSLGCPDMHANFLKIRFRKSKVHCKNTHMQHGDLKSVIVLFQNKENRLHVI